MDGSVLHMICSGISLIGKEAVMSLICIGLVNGLEDIHIEAIKEKQRVIADKKGIFVFFSISWGEEFVQRVKHNYLFSLADNEKYDNCEMLLLPDGWEYNNHKNMIPFRIRAEYFREMIEPLTDLGYIVDLFIGTSGDTFEDFIPLVVDASDLGRIINETWGVYGEEKRYHYIVVPK